MTLDHLECQLRFDELLDAVERGEKISITRNGIIIAGLEPFESNLQTEIYTPKKLKESDFEIKSDARGVEDI